MFDYKEVLRTKAGEVGRLLAKWGERLSDERRNNIRILLDNTLEITNGRLDALDYEVREEAIQNYTNQLTAALTELERFEPELEQEPEEK